MFSQNSFSSRINSALLAEDSTTLEKTQKFSRSKVILQRMVVARGLVEIAHEIGYEDFVVHIFPIIQEHLLVDPVAEIRVLTLKNFGDLTGFLIQGDPERGYQLVVSDLVGSLHQVLSKDTDHNVKRAATEALILVTPQIRASDRSYFVLPIVLSLAHDPDNPSNRALAAAALAELSESLGSNLCSLFVIPELCSLAEDAAVTVCTAAVLSIATVSKTATRDVVATRLLPTFLSLVTSPHESIRIACAESLWALTKALPLNQKCNRLPDVVRSFLNDPSQRVRRATQRILGHFLVALQTPDRISHDLLIEFLGLASMEPSTKVDLLPLVGSLDVSSSTLLGLYPTFFGTPNEQQQSGAPASPLGALSPLSSYSPCVMTPLVSTAGADTFCLDAALSDPRAACAYTLAAVMWVISGYGRELQAKAASSGRTHDSISIDDFEGPPPEDIVASSVMSYGPDTLDDWWPTLRPALMTLLNYTDREAAHSIRIPLASSMPLLASLFLRDIPMGCVRIRSSCMTTDITGTDSDSQEGASSSSDGSGPTSNGNFTFNDSTQRRRRRLSSRSDHQVKEPKDDEACSTVCFKSKRQRGSRQRPEVLCDLESLCYTFLNDACIDVRIAMIRSLSAVLKHFPQSVQTDYMQFLLTFIRAHKPHAELTSEEMPASLSTSSGGTHNPLTMVWDAVKSDYDDNRRDPSTITKCCDDNTEAVENRPTSPGWPTEEDHTQMEIFGGVDPCAEDTPTFKHVKDTDDDQSSTPTTASLGESKDTMSMDGVSAIAAPAVIVEHDDTPDANKKEPELERELPLLRIVLDGEENTVVSQIALSASPPLEEGDVENPAEPSASLRDDGTPIQHVAYPQEGTTLSGQQALLLSSNIFTTCDSDSLPNETDNDTGDVGTSTPRPSLASPPCPASPHEGSPHFLLRRFSLVAQAVSSRSPRHGLRPLRRILGFGKGSKEQKDSLFQPELQMCMNGNDDSATTTIMIGAGQQEQCWRIRYALEFVDMVGVQAGRDVVWPLFLELAMDPAAVVRRAVATITGRIIAQLCPVLEFYFSHGGSVDCCFKTKGDIAFLRQRAPTIIGPRSAIEEIDSEVQSILRNYLFPVTGRLNNAACTTWCPVNPDDTTEGDIAAINDSDHASNYLMMPPPDFLEGPEVRIIRTLLWNFAQSTNYQHRASFIRMAESVLLHCSKGFFQLYFLRPLVRLSADPVRNVRWVWASTLRTHLRKNGRLGSNALMVTAAASLLSSCSQQLCHNPHLSLRTQLQGGKKSATLKRSASASSVDDLIHARSSSRIPYNRQFSGTDVARDQLNASYTSAIPQTFTASPIMFDRRVDSSFVGDGAEIRCLLGSIPFCSEAETRWIDGLDLDDLCDATNNDNETVVSSLTPVSTAATPAPTVPCCVSLSTRSPPLVASSPPFALDRQPGSTSPPGGATLSPGLHFLMPGTKMAATSDNNAVGTLHVDELELAALQNAATSPPSWGLPG